MRLHLPHCLSIHLISRYQKRLRIFKWTETLAFSFPVHNIFQLSCFCNNVLRISLLPDVLSTFQDRNQWWNYTGPWNMGEYLWFGPQHRTVRRAAIAFGDQPPYVNPSRDAGLTKSTRELRLTTSWPTSPPASHSAQTCMAMSWVYPWVWVGSISNRVGL